MTPRGKAIRRVQNARTYAKHHGRHGSTIMSFQRKRSLPRSLTALATLPLPNSFLFNQALAGSNLIDESDLSQWDDPPPYSSPPPSDTPDEARFTRNLIDVMHGRHCRLEKERRARYAQIFGARDTSLIWGEIWAAEMKLIGTWDELYEYVLHMEGCERHKKMAECYMRRQAREILNYHCEADLLAQGQNPYK
jgi:hypothetical protein